MFRVARYAMSDPTLEPVVFGTAVDGMRRALGDQLTPAIRQQLIAVGIDFDKVQAAYSLDTWLAVVRTLAASLAADVPEDERYRHLGRLFMRGFVETPLGFAALTTGKVFGIKRTLLRMGRNFRTAANYIESELVEVGPKEVRIRTYIHEKFLPRVTDRSLLISEYRQGVLQEVVALLGGKGEVRLVEAHLERQDVTFRITWA